MKDAQFVNATESLGTPRGHYAHAAIAGPLIFLSGQLPIDASGKPLTEAPFEDQSAQVFDNLDRVLAACGASRTDLVQVRVYLVDIEQWPLFNRLYAAWLGEHRPARAVVPVPALHYGLALEIEAVACNPTVHSDRIAG
jgi:reactive intermediate/imine deaminase